jgi:hypothetical protein
MLRYIKITKIYEMKNLTLGQWAVLRLEESARRRVLYYRYFRFACCGMAVNTGRNPTCNYPDHT